jgi:hypothetical protein
LKKSKQQKRQKSLFQVNHQKNHQVNHQKNKKE